MGSSAAPKQLETGRQGRRRTTWLSSCLPCLPVASVDPPTGSSRKSSSWLRRLGLRKAAKGATATDAAPERKEKRCEKKVNAKVEAKLKTGGKADDKRRAEKAVSFLKGLLPKARQKNKSKTGPRPDSLSSTKLEPVRTGNSHRRPSSSADVSASGSSISASNCRKPATLTVPSNDSNMKASENDKSDPMAGLSVLMVVLLMLAFCGWTIAVIGTSAWFYTLSLLRSSAEDAGGGSEEKDHVIEIGYKSERCKNKGCTLA